MVTSTKESRWQQLQRELGVRLSERLFRECAASGANSTARAGRRPTASLVLAFAIATGVYAVATALTAAGLYFLVIPWTNLLQPILGVGFILLAWAARPRPVEPPRHLISRSDFPTLHTLCQRIACQLEAPPLTGIGVSTDFGANYRTAGWRSQRFIEIGTPLLAVLNRDERIAVLAHELAHGANGDPLRGRYLFGAVMMLSTWGVAVRPLSIGTSGDGMAFGPIISIIAIPFELAQLLVSELIFQLAKSMLLLTCRQSQRAEYLADRLAAQVAGTAASQSALEKTYLEKVVSSALRTRALMSLDGPLEDFLNNAANAVPEPELQALREESRASKWQVDATHPPTAYRVEMLALGGHSFPLILLSPEEQCALDAEMSKLIASNQRSVIDREIEALYQ